MRHSAEIVAKRGVFLIAILGLLGLPYAPALAATAPALSLRTSTASINIPRFRGQPVYIDAGIFLAVSGGTFELHARRPVYSEPIHVSQVLREADGSIAETRTLPDAIVDSWLGLEDFLNINVTDSEGKQVAELATPFCPNGYGRERIDDSGPFRPSYPEGCFTNPFARSTVWGIDPGWAVNTMGYEGPVLDLPLGRYTLTASIAQTYVELFAIDPAQSSATVAVRVVRGSRDCFKCHRPLRSSQRQLLAEAVPIVPAPDPATLPDLYSLPSWGISVENRRVRSFLNFGATIGVSGASSMVVEGFRRPGADEMDAYQYFFDGGDIVGKAVVGTLAFDTRRGHQHWHFLQFARYSLLDATQHETVLSKKEAFCLAPTDALDLALDGAVWNPGAIGLYSACGGANSLWVRETLPLGWGDTYFQGTPGQSFNVTNLPNGTYFIRVEANPAGLLHEQSAANNVELREIQIKGPEGARRVVVPPWNGIDTEKGMFGEGRA